MLSSDEGARGFSRMQTRSQGTTKSASRPQANKAKVKNNVAASGRRTKNQKWRAGMGSINKTTGTQVSNGGARGGARSGYNSNSNAVESDAAEDDSNREQGVRYVSRCEVVAEYEDSDDEQYFPDSRFCVAEKLDAGLTPSERSSMLGEDMPGGATQDASQMTLESIESNNGAKQYQTRTHSRGYDSS